MAAIVVMTFDADGLHRSVLETYLSKSVVVVVKNSPCHQVDLVVWAQFRTDFRDSLAFLSLVNNQSGLHLQAILCHCDMVRSNICGGYSISSTLCGLSVPWALAEMFVCLASGQVVGAGRLLFVSGIRSSAVVGCVVTRNVVTMRPAIVLVWVSFFG
jgi:hypothetical protein